MEASKERNDKVVDETEYLRSSLAMEKHLDKAAEQEKNGEGIVVSLEDICNLAPIEAPKKIGTNKKKEKTEMK